MFISGTRRTSGITTPPPRRSTPPRSTGRLWTPKRLVGRLSGTPCRGAWWSLSAREGPSIFRWASKFPVIVFSHGNLNVPIDYSFTMEDLASAGFVVAAPNHVNNTQDDLRMDYANAQADSFGLP